MWRLAFLCDMTHLSTQYHAFTCDMMQSCVCDAFGCDTTHLWAILLNIFDITHSYAIRLIYVWNDAFYEWNDVIFAMKCTFMRCHSFMSDTTQYSWCKPFMCDMTHLCAPCRTRMCHDAFVCEAFMCDITHVRVIWRTLCGRGGGLGSRPQKMYGERLGMGSSTI